MKPVYIPIWIDLKETKQEIEHFANESLHSNMDRFESELEKIKEYAESMFTFQYG